MKHVKLFQIVFTRWLVLFYLMVFARIEKANSQEIIIKTNGERIMGFVRESDSSYVYVVVKNNGLYKRIKISKDSIQTIRKYESEKGKYARVMNTIGIGLGLDHGGIGLNFLMYPQENFGVFIGIGYAYAGIGINGGLKLRLVSSRAAAAPFILAMYGYNSAISVTNASVYNKFFYGPTFGIGFDLQPKAARKSYLSFGILIPIRGSEEQEYIDRLNRNYGVVFKSKLLPFAISLGYKFAIN